MTPPVSLDRLDESVKDPVLPSQDRLTPVQDPSGMEVVKAQRAGLGSNFADRYYWNGDAPITYRTMSTMMRDPSVRLGVSMIVEPLRCLDYVVSCRVEEIRDFVNGALRPVWTELLRASLTALPYGYAALEKIFMVGDLEVGNLPGKSRDFVRRFSGKILPKKYVQLVPDREVTYPRLSSDGSFLGLVNQPRQSFAPVFVPAEKCFVYTPDPENGNLLGRPLLEVAYRDWYYKQVIRNWWGMYLEKRAIPSLLGYAPAGSRKRSDGTSINLVEEQEKILRRIKAGQPVAYPSEFHPETKEPLWRVETLTSDPRGDLFSQAISYCDLSIVRALLGPEKSAIQGTGRTGTFAETRVHSDATWNMAQRWVDSLQAAINTHIIPQLVALNFPSPWPECRVEIESVRAWDREAFKDVLGALKQGTIAITGSRRGAAGPGRWSTGSGRTAS